VIDESEPQNEKQDDSRIATFRGIKIDRSTEYENADDSICVKCEFDSNVIDESDLQFEKHFDPRISTLLGIKIDSSDDDKKASDSIRVKREFDSNVIDESDLQYKKQCDPRISILLSILIIDDSEKCRINLCLEISIRMSFSITKISLTDSIEIADKGISINAEPSMN
jgi:hypothetical protein